MNRDLFKDLCLAHGISGFEKEVTRLFKDHIEESVDEVFYDNIGSIIGVKKGNPKLKILFAGHVDEIGMVVKEIDKKGYVRVQQVGTLFAHSLGAQEVVLKTRDGKKLKGVVGTHAKNPNFVLNKDSIPIEDIMIDFGVYSKKELMELGVRIGDPITPSGYFQVMNNPNFISASSIDDRVGVSLVIELANRLKDIEIDADLYFAGTVQEEVGLRGAKTVAQMIQPDLSIALDVYPCNDTSNDPAQDYQLGKGTTICLLDTASIGHIGLIEFLEDLCQTYKIPYQETMISRGGTDSGELHKVGKGSVNVSLAIPNRYVHTQRSIINTNDYKATLNVLEQFCLCINPRIFNKIINKKI